MKIRAGYEICYDCPQPTPMILTLSVYPSRTADLLSLGSHEVIRLSRQHLSRQLWQFLPRDPRSRGPADHVYKLSGAGQWGAGRGRVRSSAFGRRSGPTVRLMVGGDTSTSFGFAMRNPPYPN